MKFKKLTAAAMAAAMLTAAVPLAVTLNNAISVTASAAETGGDWEYMVNEDEETVTITKYNGTDNDVIIPSTLGGKSVIAIAYLTFEDYTSLTSLTIPDCVTNIGDSFEGCTRLTAINVDENNENYCSVDGVLFNKDKTGLVRYPTGKTEKSYTISNSVTSIDYASFRGCTNLTSVTIPDSVTDIDGRAFEDCTSLTSVTIPNSITYFINHTFSGCTSLTSITIPASVTRITNDTFYGCTSLTAINVDENNEKYSSVDGVLFNKDKTVLEIFPFNKAKSYAIPNRATNIDEFAFYCCTGLTSVTIPNSITDIGTSAFYFCTSLTSITIPDSVTIIEPYTFYQCSSLTTVKYSGTKAEWNAIEISSNGNECLTNAEIICTDGIINEREPETSEPTSSDTSEPTSSTTSEPAESTLTPGSTDPVSEPTSSTDEPTVLETTLKNVDSEKGIEGAALDELLFGESGWTWAQVEKIVFTSDSLFSVQYTAVDGTTKTLGEKSAQRAENDGIWSTEWTLDTSLMSKDNSFVKLIAKEGTADIKATIYIKKGAEKPTAGSDQANTGIALAIAPAALACAAVIAVSKKKK